MSYKFWADVNTKPIVYYRPISEAEAIKLNSLQDDFHTTEYVEVDPAINSKIDDAWMRPVVKSLSPENFWNRRDISFWDDDDF